ncbi:ATPase WRNIP1-like [Amphiura filiformis]|uniref:ATPase WRNIP1-like n=1 Tax=Amphiura filiformis TaxID=82378 RepID=UPI003B20EC65
MASNATATCPICSKLLPFSDINTHIDSCLANVEVEPPNTAQKRKRDNEDPGVSDQPKKKSAWGSLLRNPMKTSQKKQLSDDKTKQRKTSTSFSKDAKSEINDTKCSGNEKSPKTSDDLNSEQSEVEVLPSGKLGQSRNGKSYNSLSTASLSSSSQQPKSKPKVDFRPLPERMRPKQLGDYIGQSKAVGRNSMLRRLLEADEVPSMILWGPPGCGKTTLAHVIAEKAKQSGKGRFVTLSATTSNVAQVKDVIAAAKNDQKMFKRQTILFIDEIHRFNKLQQDTFLPHVENGTIILIGATTENPSFKVNSALLSRCRVIVLDKLSIENLTVILERALFEIGVKIVEEDDGSSGESEDEGTEGRNDMYIERYAVTTLASLCDGDARAALNALQMTVQSQQATSSTTAAATCNKNADRSNEAAGSDEDPIREKHLIKVCHVKEGLQRSHILYDRAGDEHFNCISALHKSMRGCDANAALYWMGRMLLGGEDPLYVARRLIEFATADIGLADPQALVQAVSTFQACQFLGMPVCEIHLAQCVLYLSKAPKSNLVETVYNRVKKCIEEHEGPVPGVPLHLRNPSTPLMQKLGYGKGYNPRAKQQYMPEGMEGVNFLEGTEYEYS